MYGLLYYVPFSECHIKWFIKKKSIFSPGIFGIFTKL